MTGITNSNKTAIAFCTGVSYTIGVETNTGDKTMTDLTNDGMNLAHTSINDLALFHDPVLSVRSFRMLRKGCACWLSDEVCQELKNTESDPEAARQLVANTGVLPTTGTKLTQADLVVNEFDATFIGAVKHKEMKLGKFTPRDHYEVFCINHSPDALMSWWVGDAVVNVMSFLSPCSHNDPIQQLIQRSTVYYARQTLKPLAEGETRPTLAELMVQPVRFVLSRSKTNYGVIAFLQAAACQTDAETQQVYQQFGTEWIKANAGQLPSAFKTEANTVDDADLVF